MSILPGGPADKAGGIHESLWGVVGMVSVLCEEARSIRIEKPGLNGAEFFLDVAGTEEHWQAKRHIIGQKTWSLLLLKREGVIDFFQERIKAGETCVFASISDLSSLNPLITWSFSTGSSSFIISLPSQ